MGDTSTLLEWHLTHQTVVVPSPSREFFVVATHLATELDIFGVDGKLRQPSATPRTITPLRRPSSPSPDSRDAFMRLRRYGYISVATFDSGFFAVYSGRNSRETPRRATSGSTLEYYDWRGRMTKAFGLDRDIAIITTTRSGDTVFAVTRDDIPVVVEYSLRADRAHSP